jgi:NAD-dependent dihydropyrimidine dehydrogenase PreA subunit
MVDTLGSTSGGIVGPLRKIVSENGYNPVGAMEIQMPSNIFFIQDEKTNKNKVQKGLEAAEKYALDLVNEKAEWGRVPILSDAVNLFSRGTLKLTGVDLHQKLFLFKVNKEKCNKCGICVGICPTRNIKIDGGNYPVHGLNCQYCLRCTSFCPKRAIPCKFNYKGKTYAAVKAKEFLKIRNL